MSTQSARSSRILSLSYLTVRGASPRAQVDAARACGFSHVSLRFLPVLAGEALVPVPGDPARMAETQRCLRDNGVEVLDVEFFWIKPGTRPHDFLPCIEAAARLGARNLIAGAADPDKNRFTDNWLAFCELAAASNLRSSLEFIPNPDMSTIASYAEAIALMRSAPHRAAAVTLDALHFFRAGGRAADIRPEHHGFISSVQLCDAPAGRPSPAEMQRQSREDRLPPGCGALDLRGLMQALPPSLPMALEAPVLATQDRSPQQRARFVADAAKPFFAHLDPPAA